jgi:hypothetical protein
MEQRVELETLALSRVIERRDAPTDWTSLETLARQDETLWARLAESLRQDAELRASAVDVAALAAGVELPASAAVRSRRSLPRLVPVAPTTKVLLAGAALVLAWIVAHLPASNDDAAVGTRSPGTAGERLGELVPVVVERRPIAGGDEVELILMRRYLEREVVPRLYELGVDEYEVPIVQPVWDAGASEIEFL